LLQPCHFPRFYFSVGARRAVLAFLTLLGSIASVQGKPGKTGEKEVPLQIEL
jgi:hypothetical protein